jgi:hypothetical protein
MQQGASVMSIVLVDIFCLLLVGLGLALLLKRPANGRGGIGRSVSQAGNNPQTYILRIAGVMIITFGFALGLMATVYHFI